MNESPTVVVELAEKSMGQPPGSVALSFGCWEPEPPESRTGFMVTIAGFHAINAKMQYPAGRYDLGRWLGSC